MSARKVLRGTAFGVRILAAVLAGAVLTAAATALLPLLLPGLAWKALRERRTRQEHTCAPCPNVRHAGCCGCLPITRSP